MTPSPITTRFDVRQPEGKLTAEIVSSLPVSYGPAYNETATLAAVDGTSGIWTDDVRKELEAARYVVVFDPTVGDGTQVRQLAQVAAGRVALSDTWAGNPVLRAVRDAWEHDVANSTLIEVSLVEPTNGAERRDLLFRAVRIIEALGAAAPRFGAVFGDERGFTATTPGGAMTLVTVFATRTNADGPAARVILNAPSATIQVDLPSAATARPATARRVTVDGASELPTVWQTAHRSTFQRIHETIAGGADIDDLDAYTAALSGIELVSM